MSRLPLLTALQGSCPQSSLCNSQSQCFLSFQVVLDQAASPDGCTHSPFGVAEILCFLGRVPVSLAPLALSTVLMPLNTYPITGRTTWWFGCSRWSTSHSYLFVCSEKKINSHLLYHPFSSWRQYTKLRGELALPPQPHVLHYKLLLCLLHFQLITAFLWLGKSLDWVMTVFMKRCNM